MEVLKIVVVVGVQASKPYKLTFPSTARDRPTVGPTGVRIRENASERPIIRLTICVRLRKQAAHYSLFALSCRKSICIRTLLQRSLPRWNCKKLLYPVRCGVDSGLLSNCNRPHSIYQEVQL